MADRNATDVHATGAKRADLTEAMRLSRFADDEGLELRILGGLAVAIHCPQAPETLVRKDHADLDLVSGSGRGIASRLDSFFERQGFHARQEFNALHGQRRRLYATEENLQVDVFVSEFSMCHSVPIGERLGADAPTIPLAELLVTKAQVVELNEKDIRDLLALLAEHEIGGSDEETINGPRVAELCSRDWGLWRTVTGTLARIGTEIEHYRLDRQKAHDVRARIDDLFAAIDEAPKSLKWKARARIGDRMAWYELPDEKRV